ncbi:MAG TPA: acyclic terpene utilization AtuA family protein [Pseudolabrys sp.]|nr:acyclic terpene utilization AtuA family protein [Pseudolabrys sp.]
MDGKVFIGCAAGFAGDRSDASGPVAATLAGHAGPRFLIYETLAERTLALCQLQRRKDPARGYSPALDRLLTPVLAQCLAAGIKVVGNFGSANPPAAARRVAGIASALGLTTPRIAIVEGDDLSGRLSAAEFAQRETGGKILARAREIISANLYLGAQPIAEALDRGADIVVTGRVADSALALGPLLHAFRWRADDWDRLAAGTLAGHLLECGAQVTGGYFADPGYKDVSGLAAAGYPIAEIDRDGDIVITKPPGSGGLVDRLTVIEQLLYEIHDPAAYLAPDVVLDLTGVEVDETGKDRVRVTGARGRPAPETLKATVCVDGGTLGEAEISYAGPNAAARAMLAIDIVRRRMAQRVPELAIRVDAIGAVSVLGTSTVVPDLGRSQAEDIRLRFAAQSANAADIEILLDEVEALYCAGPAGGAGVRRHATPRLASAACLIERRYAEPCVTLLGASA